MNGIQFSGTELITSYATGARAGRPAGGRVQLAAEREGLGGHLVAAAALAGGQADGLFDAPHQVRVLVADQRHLLQRRAGRDLRGAGREEQAGRPRPEGEYIDQLPVVRSPVRRG
jgi:hypothetical protein